MRQILIRGCILALVSSPVIWAEDGGEQGIAVYNETNNFIQSVDHISALPDIVVHETVSGAHQEKEEITIFSSDISLESGKADILFDQDNEEQEKASVATEEKIINPEVDPDEEGVEEGGELMTISASSSEFIPPDSKDITGISENDTRIITIEDSIVTVIRK